MLRYAHGSWKVLREAGLDWMKHKDMQLGAALAFYSILSIAPLLVIAIALAGLVFGEEAARGHLVTEFEAVVGSDGATAIRDMLAHSQEPAKGTLAAALGIITLLFGASGVFAQLQDAMNTIWEVPPKEESGIWDMIRNRFLSFAMVLGTGFLLLISLVLSAVIAGIGTYMGGWLPKLEPLWHFANEAVTFAVVTCLFAMIFKILPNTNVIWRDVWIGAVLTSILFMVGKVLIGLYLGKSGLGSTYGAAGSLVVLVVWVYYSAQILFFGAEITQAYSRQHGSQMNRKPKEAEQRIPNFGRSSATSPRGLT